MSVKIFVITISVLHTLPVEGLVDGTELRVSVPRGHDHLQASPALGELLWRDLLCKVAASTLMTRTSMSYVYSSFSGSGPRSRLKSCLEGLHPQASTRALLKLYLLIWASSTPFATSAKASAATRDKAADIIDSYSSNLL